MESLQHVEHRSVIVVEELTGDVDAEIWRDPDEILVERSVMDRAQRQPVRHEWSARLLGVADDVRGVQQPYFAKPADRAAIAVRGKHRTPELRLMDPLLDFAHDVAPLDLVGDVDGLALVVRPAHEGQKDSELGGFVAVDIGWVDRPVPVRPRADEVDDRHVEQMGTPQPAVEVVLRVVALVAVEHAIWRLLVLRTPYVKGDATARD